VHSGWRGAAAGITRKTLQTLGRETGFDPRETTAWLGPSIRACCFEVGEEVASQFGESYIDRSRTKPHVDLVAFTAAVLRDAGIQEVSDSGLCTRCDGSIFHSYRRGADGGRNLAVVAM
jgi:copper oxidase (laccase) domain-containing protein